MCSRWSSLAESVSAKVEEFEQLLAQWELWDRELDLAQSWVGDRQREVTMLLLRQDNAPSVEDHRKHCQVSTCVLKKIGLQ